MTQDGVSEEKRRLREDAKRRRAAAHAAADTQTARRLAAHGLDFLKLPAAAIVSGFMPMPDEIDVVPLLAWLHAEGTDLCLPVMQGKGKPLLFRAWAPGDDMVTAVWGIREPMADKPVVEPDVLLVPLLAFDAHGWRLGYGGGFYDRSISALGRFKRITTVGIAYDAQEVDAVPHLDYDERLDWVLTPAGPRRFER
jgi:5-formyltetrahydrofolate cyclo-ligase